MYTRKVRGITSTLAQNIVFLDTVTLTYPTFYIMHVNAVLFGSLIYTVIIRICICSYLLGGSQLVGRLDQAAVSIIWNLVREPGVPELKFGPKRLFRGDLLGDEILASFILWILIKPNVWHIVFYIDPINM